jgi:hypothetical protein
MIALQAGDRWVCKNTACRAEVSVLKSSELDAGTNPKCSCGSAMKKSYSKPVLRPLSPEEAEGLFPKTEKSGEVEVRRSKYRRT